MCVNVQVRQLLTVHFSKMSNDAALLIIRFTKKKNVFAFLTENRIIWCQAIN